MFPYLSLTGEVPVGSVRVKMNAEGGGELRLRINKNLRGLVTVGSEVNWYILHPSTESGKNYIQMKQHMWRMF